MAGEQTLWRRWRKTADRRAFEALVGLLEGFAFDFARRVSGRAADAEDLAQDAFLTLSQAADDRPIQVGLRAFLGQRIRLQARMLTRAALTRTRHEQAAAAIRPDGVSYADHTEAEEALALLEGDERQAVELRFLHGMSHREIGHVLGWSEVNARVRIHRALQTLREKYGERVPALVAGLPLFGPPRSFAKTTVRTAVATGGVVLMAGTKKVALLVALCVGALVVWDYVDRREPTPRRESERREQRELVRRDGAAPVRAQNDKSEGVDPKQPLHAGAGKIDNAPPPAPQEGITGVMRWKSGAPIARVKLTLGGSPKQIVETDEHGRFLFLPLGSRECELALALPARTRVAIKRVQAHVGQMITADITLERGVVARGRVRRADSNLPLADQEVQILREGDTNDGQGMWAITYSDAEGTFEIPHLLPGEYRVRVQRKGFEPFGPTIQVAANAAAFDFALKPARKLVVAFLELPPAWERSVVHLQLHGDGINPVWLDLRLDEKGEVEIDAPAPGKYQLTTIPGHESPFPTFEVDLIVEADVAPRIEITLGGATVEGRLTWADGSPAKDVVVALPRRQVTVKTDADGRYRFGGLPKGHFGIEARIGRARFQIGQIAAKEREVIRRDHRFGGHRTLRATPRVPGSYFVTLLREGVTVVYVQGRSGRELAIPKLADGAYVVRVGAAGHAARDYKAVLAGEDLDLAAITVGAAYPNVPIRLIVAEGQKFDRHYVHAENSDGETRMARLRLDSHGVGVLTKLPAGRWKVDFIVDKTLRRVEIDVRHNAEEVRVEFPR